ncbi:CD1107 family mobile element protein [Peptoniphilus sp. HCN-40583]|uniref:CD1107 family mobile element protein n=1 Tax=Peptoniphilus sp. HCN-40583 TaxID=3134662 RepID=UPI0030C0FA4E
MRRIKKGASLVLLLTLLILPMNVFAGTEGVVKEKGQEIYEPENQKEGLDQLLQKEDLYSPSNEEIPYQDVPKVPERKEEKVKPVNGGNEKAINPLATKENKARGTVIENVDRQDKDITPKKEDIVEEQKEATSVNPEQTNESSNQKPIDMRQFLTFQTKSGKTFHLIVDHGEHEENVQLLTEVGEQDLLNMIEGESDFKPKKEEVKKVQPEKVEEAKEEVKEEKKSGAGLYLFVGLIVAGVLGAGYYFKVYKKEEDEEDDTIYDEWEDEYEYDGTEKDEDFIDENPLDEDEQDTEILVPDEDDFE